MEVPHCQQHEGGDVAAGRRCRRHVVHGRRRWWRFAEFGGRRPQLVRSRPEQVDGWTAARAPCLHVRRSRRSDAGRRHGSASKCAAPPQPIDAAPAAAAEYEAHCSTSGELLLFFNRFQILNDVKVLKEV